MSGEKLLVNRSNIVKSFDMYVCKIQNLKVGPVLIYCLSCWFKKSLLQSLQ